MTAAALSSVYDPNTVEIVLVESDAIGTVGVGEATIPDILKFNAMLGLREDEFMRATDATFKLGIQFVDWGRKGDVYVHPFGEHGADLNGIDFHHYWLAAHETGDVPAIEEFSLCAVAAKAGKFALPSRDARSVLSQMGYAYHFDANLYGRFLRRFAEGRGVRRIEGEVREVGRDPSSGFVTEVRLSDDRAVSGDFFFDCSGFRALLHEGALDVPFIDWSHWLPCDRAQVVPSAHVGPIKPLTTSTAKTGGWQWRIPTQRRIGNGHVYCSAFMDDVSAAEVLLETVDGPPLSEPRRIAFRTGHRRSFWEKNCVAIGLSAGFIEPLESTSIHLIQQGISRFIALMPDTSLPETLRREYNRSMRADFEEVRDFIVLHYKATERNDSPFWDYCRTMDVPDSLQRKIDLFRESGRAFRHGEELFARPSWVAVFLGQNILPSRLHPVASQVPEQKVRQSLSSMRRAITTTADTMPSHEDFLSRYCGWKPSLQ
ncbi:tryptophan halogenase [Parvularcula dongshanensis]|uniref:Tryptophan halogenase n=2 Tax=Parvularcula dongshanensis TaxID=1173995 RepID=A0A840I6D5_9PROT|nr:tryptophan halogenase [Parvularcula dongshanensis]